MKLTLSSAPLTLSLIVIVLAGCQPDPDPMADTGVLADQALPDGPAKPKAWDPGQADSSKIARVRGLRVARTIVHSHSLNSHDACDGKPTLKDGSPNEKCLTSLKLGLCKTRTDMLMLTEHITSLSLVTFDKLLLLRGGDEAILKGGAKVASRFKCADAFRPIMTVGAELSATMPLGLEKHVAGAPAQLKAIYGSSDTSLDTKLRAAGAVIYQAHTESKELTELKAHKLDGIEVYNLHANLDPTIREKYLGLSKLGYINDLAPFFGKDETSPEADLAFLSFFVPSDNAIKKWSALLALRPTAGVLGTDAHQNVLPLPARDGERMDSYRRMFRWFSNHMRVTDITVDKVKEALRVGRGYMVFEVIGTPDGFDFYAEAGGNTLEMGGEALASAAPLLKVSLPTLLDTDPMVTPPEMDLRLLHVDSAGQQKVVAAGKSALSYKATAAGAYRAEVYIVPRHLTSYLGPTPAKYVKRMLWIYSNPIYVK